MEQIILVVHLVVSLAIIGLIMLQQGKGADMGASFGAGASQTLFGSEGSGNALTKATAWLVVLFFASSFGLALVASQQASPTDDLGLELPAVVEEAPMALPDEMPAVEDDLPVVEDDVPAMSGAVEDDLPSLD